MGDWWTYRPEDFLLFSEQVYWRLFSLHNTAVWPAQIVALAVGIGILLLPARRQRYANRLIAVVLVAAWLFVAWAFLWIRYRTINWAAGYIVPFFVLEALLIALVGVIGNRLRLDVRATVGGVIGIALLVYAIFLHPLVPIIAGRPVTGAEVFGIAPDPTAIATLGVLSLAARGLAVGLVFVVPALWCVLSWLTLHTMDVTEAWIPLGAVSLAVIAQIWPREPASRQ